MRWGLVLFLLSSSTPLQNSSADSYWIVWNVGQGLWTTRVQPQECWHFDAGGERWPRLELKRLCSKKLNRLFLSHGDMDHINGVSWLRRENFQLCLAAGPREPGLAAWKKALLEPLLPCPPWGSPPWREISGPLRAKQANRASRVWLLENRTILSGDSPKSEEPFWLEKLPRRDLVRRLVVGHHGSRTSTSKILLQRLPQLRQALISARHSRYKHPHPETLREIKRAGVPALLTEHWGHLIYEEPALLN